MPKSSNPFRQLSELHNLGPKSQAIMARAGIDSVSALQRIGAVPAYMLARAQEPRVSMNLLYALVGAIEGRDWRDIQRERRLELLNALEEHQRGTATAAPVVRLQDLRNIGKAMLKDFELLGIKSVDQLAQRDPDLLYARIQQITAIRHDPCVWDTYAAAIHQARTGEALPWWAFTKIRKARPDAHLFDPPGKRRVRP